MQQNRLKWSRKWLCLFYWKFSENLYSKFILFQTFIIQVNSASVFLGDSYQPKVRANCARLKPIVILYFSRTLWIFKHYEYSRIICFGLSEKFLLAQKYGKVGENLHKIDPPPPTHFSVPGNWFIRLVCCFCAWTQAIKITQKTFLLKLGRKTTSISPSNLLGSLNILFRAYNFLMKSRTRSLNMLEYQETVKF